MPLDRESRYPSRRTFVVKLRSSAKPDALAGSVENVVTGRSREFVSGQELLESIACEVNAAGEEPSGDAAARRR